MQHLTWEEIEALARGAYRLLAYGPPGTGKSTLAYTTAQALGMPFYNVTLTDETPAAELRGHFVPDGNKWPFMYGPATRAFSEGALLLLDEIDKASQDCLDFLHGLLNDPKLARITLPTGEVLTAHPNFKVIATMNGEYEDLRPSLQDRFSIAIEIDQPHPAAIEALPEDLQGAARNLESYDHHQRPSTVRRWAALASLRDIPEIGMEIAAKAVFAHRAPELVDALRFRDSTTTGGGHGGATMEEYIVDEEAVEEEEEYTPPVCSCDTCMEKRNRAWLNWRWGSGYPYWSDDYDAYMCPKCDASWSEEKEAAECCYDDAEWVVDCHVSGRSHGSE